MTKTNILLLGSILIVSCKSNNIENNEIIITTDYLSEHNLSGMGSDYKIKKLMNLT